MRALLALTVAGAGVRAAPAHAADVARVAARLEHQRPRRRSRRGRVGRSHAATASAPSVGRADADGVLPHASRPTRPLLGGTLGPGRSGVVSRRAGPDRARRQRGAADDARTRSKAPTAAGFAFATGPDGTVWAPTIVSLKLARITPDRRGDVHAARSCPTAAGRSRSPTWPAPSDGAVWIAELLCERLIRVAPDGTAKIVADEFSGRSIAGDLAGGMWFVGRRPGSPGTSTPPAGHATRARRRERARRGGRARRRRLVRARPLRARARAPRAAPTIRPAPVPASELAFDPAGGLWLASRRHLVHTTLDALSAACDGTPPKVTAVTPRAISASPRCAATGCGCASRSPRAAARRASYDFGGIEQLFAAGRADRRARRARRSSIARRTRRLRRIARELAARPPRAGQPRDRVIGRRGQQRRRPARWRVTR